MSFHDQIRHSLCSKRMYELVQDSKVLTHIELCDDIDWSAFVSKGYTEELRSDAKTAIIHRFPSWFESKPDFTCTPLALQELHISPLAYASQCGGRDPDSLLSCVMARALGRMVAKHFPSAIHHFGADPGGCATRVAQGIQAGFCDEPDPETPYLNTQHGVYHGPAHHIFRFTCYGGKETHRMTDDDLQGFLDDPGKERMLSGWSCLSWSLLEKSGTRRSVAIILSDADQRRCRELRKELLELLHDRIEQVADISVQPESTTGPCDLCKKGFNVSDIAVCSGVNVAYPPNYRWWTRADVTDEES